MALLLHATTLIVRDCLRFDLAVSSAQTNFEYLMELAPWCEYLCSSHCALIEASELRKKPVHSPVRVKRRAEGCWQAGICPPPKLVSAQSDIIEVTELIRTSICREMVGD